MQNSQKLPSLSIFFPAHNEADNIAKTIIQADAIAQKVSHDYEIIIVDDGSTDNTAHIVEKLKSKYPHLKLIRHENNQGYGGAVFSGFTHASKDWIFFSDADLQFDLTELNKFAAHANKNENDEKENSVIIGYRANRQDTKIRTLNATAWKWLVYFLFGLNVKDIDCAFKLIRTDAIKPILPHIHARGAMISAEFLILLKQSGYKFTQIPVKHKPRPAGQQSGASLKVILRAFHELGQVFLQYTNPYLIKRKEKNDTNKDNYLLARFTLLWSTLIFILYIYYIGLSQAGFTKLLKLIGIN